MTPACWSWPIPEDLDLGDPRRALQRWHENRCAICEKVTKPYIPFGPRIDGAHEDHDHVTGLVRGWLCASCNNREGYLANKDHPVFEKYRRRPPAVILGVSFTYPQHESILRRGGYSHGRRSLHREGAS